MIPKRLTGDIKLITHFDPAFVTGFDFEKKNKYSETLDVDVLGDFSSLSLSERPTVFICEPLKPKYEYLAYTEETPDFWSIFATHVKEIQNGGIEMSKDGNGFLSDSVREQLTPEVYQDIANKILFVSNRMNADVFFIRPAGSLAYERLVLASHQAVVAARQAAVIDKSSNSEQSP